MLLVVFEHGLDIIIVSSDLTLTLARLFRRLALLRRLGRSTSSTGGGSFVRADSGWRWVVGNDNASGAESLAEIINESIVRVRLGGSSLGKGKAGLSIVGDGVKRSRVDFDQHGDLVGTCVTRSSDVDRQETLAVSHEASFCSDLQQFLRKSGADVV